MFSALKTQVPRQAKKSFGVYQKACFQGKKKENAYTPKGLQGVCGGPLRAALVYRSWPPIIVSGNYFVIISARMVDSGTTKKQPKEREFLVRTLSVFSFHTSVRTPSLGTQQRRAWKNLREDTQTPPFQSEAMKGHKWHRNHEISHKCYSKEV